MWHFVKSTDSEHFTICVQQLCNIQVNHHCEIVLNCTSITA